MRAAGGAIALAGLAFLSGRHGQGMSVDAFAGGLLNPLTVPAHILALLGLGLLIGRQDAGWRLIPLAAFALALAAGLAAIALALGQTPAVDVLLVATVVSGLLLALALALPNVVCAVVAVVVGAALGLDSPPQVILMADAALALIGTWLGASCALAVVTAFASRLTRDWQRIGVRIVGSWIAASAILVLALRFARGMLFVIAAARCQRKAIPRLGGWRTPAPRARSPAQGVRATAHPVRRRGRRR